MHYRYNLSPFQSVTCTSKKSVCFLFFCCCFIFCCCCFFCLFFFFLFFFFFLKKQHNFFIYVQNKWKFLKKEMHVYKLMLCTYNEVLGLSQHFVSSCSHVCVDWEKWRFQNQINVLLIVTSDLVLHTCTLKSLWSNYRRVSLHLSDDKSINNRLW